MITPQAPSATYVATDQATGAVRCSVIVVTDLIEMMKLHTSDDDLAKIKVEAQKKRMPLSKDSVVHFTVNTMNSCHSIAIGDVHGCSLYSTKLLKYVEASQMDVSRS